MFFSEPWNTIKIWVSRGLGFFVSIKRQHPPKGLLIENSTFRKERFFLPKSDRDLFGPIVWKHKSQVSCNSWVFGPFPQNPFLQMLLLFFFVFFFFYSSFSSSFFLFFIILCCYSSSSLFFPLNLSCFLFYICKNIFLKLPFCCGSCFLVLCCFFLSKSPPQTFLFQTQVAFLFFLFFLFLFCFVFLLLVVVIWKPFLV